MLQLNFVGAKKLEWHDVEEPKILNGGEALVRPFIVATCDLDQSIVRGSVPMKAPFAFGHEGIAEVLEVGDDVAGFRPGDVVSVPFQISCGDCGPCRKGRTAHCTAVALTSMYGLGSLSGSDWGGFLSDVVRVPFADHMLLRVPGDIDPSAVASLSDNIADGWRLVAPQLEAEPGAVVLVLAGSSVALYATAIALALGASRVDFVGGGDHEREVAARLGAKVIEGPIPARLGPYRITVNASSDRACLRCAVRSTGPDGVCTSAGMYFDGEPSLPLLEMYTKGIHFHTGRVHARTVMPHALQLVVEKRIRPELVTGKIADWDQAPDALADHETKLVITRPRRAAVS